jgi:RimJ/RimL family protein N-acetyltransferase
MVAVLADTELFKFTGGEPPTNEELQRRYESQVRGSGISNERWLNWIVSQPAGPPIGFVQATVTAGVASLAWTIGVPHQGNGFASEAARRVVEWLRSSGVSMFQAHIVPGHAASERVAVAIGLQPGHLDNEGEAVWTRGPS